MSDVILMDNFENYSAVNGSSHWIGARYDTLGTTALNFTQLESRQCMTQIASTSPWLVSRLLGGLQTDIVFGFRMLGMSKTAASGVATVALGEHIDGVFHVSVAFEFTQTSVIVHYSLDGVKTIEVLPAQIGPSTYIDFIVSRDEIGNPSKNSSLTVFVENSPLKRSGWYNCAPTNLSLAVFGNIPTSVPSDLPGFCCKVDAASSSTGDAGYGVTDFFVSKNGKRFGKPIVTTVLANSVNTLMTPSVEQLPVDILNGVPNPWEFLQGATASADYDVPTGGGVAQYSVLLQPNGGDPSSVKLTSGGSEVSVPVPDTAKYVSLITTNNNNATVELT